MQIAIPVLISVLVILAHFTGFFPKLKFALNITKITAQLVDSVTDSLLDSGIDHKIVVDLDDLSNKVLDILHKHGAPGNKNFDMKVKNAIANRVSEKEGLTFEQNSDSIGFNYNKRF